MLTAVQVMKYLDVAEHLEQLSVTFGQPFWLEIRDEVLSRIREEADAHPVVVAKAARQWQTRHGYEPAWLGAARCTVGAPQEFLSAASSNAQRVALP